METTQAPLNGWMHFIYFLKIYLFIRGCGYQWAFSSCKQWGLLTSCSAQASHCGGFPCCRARAAGAQASGVAALGLSSCGTQAWLLYGLCSLSRPGIKPMSLALAGFLSTGPRGKSSLRYCNLLFGFPAPALSNPQTQSQSIFHPVSRIILSKHNAGQVAFHSGAYAGFPFHSPTI